MTSNRKVHLHHDPCDYRVEVKDMTTSLRRVTCGRCLRFIQSAGGAAALIEFAQNQHGAEYTP